MPRHCVSAPSLLASIRGWAPPRWHRSSSAVSPTLVVVDPDGAGSLPEHTTAPVVEKAEAREAWAGSAPPSWPELHPDDPVAVVWTSGTTGKPKGAIFDQLNLAAVRAGHRRLEPAWRPAALAAAVRARRLHDPGLGRDCQCGDDRHHPDALAGRRGNPDYGERAGDRGPGRARHSGRSCWPVSELARADLNALRVAGTGAAACPRPWLPSCGGRLGVPVVVRYTSTETSLGTGTTLILDRRGGGDDGREAGRGGRVGDRRRRRTRRFPTDRWVACSCVPQPPCVAIGAGVPYGAAAVRDLVDAVADTRRVLAPDGWVTTGDFGRRTPEGQLAALGPGARALHPWRVQRLSR